MDLSVVIPTLNDREQLLSAMDDLASVTPSETERIVVNGPSSDGTTGAVRERDDVDVLVEVSERDRAVQRNAGIEMATGNVIAFLGAGCRIDDGWFDAIETSVSRGADLVTGPTAGEDVSIPREPTSVARRQVTHFDGTNVAFERSVLEALDGFDEYLSVGSARDCAHRAAGFGFDVVWNGDMRARKEIGTDGGRSVEWGAQYRSRTYHLAKNYGPRPAVLGRIGYIALCDAITAARGVVDGTDTPTDWIANGVDVLVNTVAGKRDGMLALLADRSERRNPNGISARHDRAVQVYDWR